MSPEQLNLWSIAVVKNDSEDSAAALEIARDPQSEESISSLRLEGLTVAELGAALLLALDVVMAIETWENVQAAAEAEQRRADRDNDQPF